MSIWLLGVVLLVFTAFWNVYHVLTILSLVGSFNKKTIKGKIIEKNDVSVIVEVLLPGKTLYINSGFYYKNVARKLVIKQITDIIDSEDTEVDVYINKKDFRKSSLTNPELVTPLRYMAGCSACIIVAILMMVNA